jgi:hypothetical protein
LVEDNNDKIEGDTKEKEDMAQVGYTDPPVALEE